MSSGSKNCVFCVSVTGKINIFSNYTLQKCKNILSVRVQHNLKYNDVVLPVNLSASEGYHSKCYRSFTAVMKKYINHKKNERISEADNFLPSKRIKSSISAKNILSADSKVDFLDTNIPADETDGISESYDQKCIFCNSYKKKLNGLQTLLHRCNTTSFKEDLKLMAEILNDSAMLDKINCFTCLEVWYHSSCKSKYEFKAKNIGKSFNTPWHKARDCHLVAYEEVCKFIQDNVVKNNKCYFLQYITKLYKNCLSDEDYSSNDHSKKIFTVQHLERKLIKSFDKQIKIIWIHNQKVITPFNGVVLDDLEYSKMEESNVVQKAAFILRELILKIKKNKLADTLTVESMIIAECAIPDLLNEFYLTLLSGSVRRRRENPDCLRKVKSFSEDAIYAVHNGCIKTSKHIALGTALKSLTSSRKVINILNRYGHCCSYNVVEELETEATFSSTSRSGICPEDIVLSPELCTGVAFDNFDRFVDTYSGKDTLHDTVGIIFQDIIPGVGVLTDTFENGIIESGTNNDNGDLGFVGVSRMKRRRAFDAIIPELEPYYKKPKVVEYLKSADSDLRLLESTNLNLIQRIDFAWMLSHTLKIPNTPMWVGFNSKIVRDISPKQRISYLNPINLSPTNVSVVLETMIQAQKIAEECKQSYMQITYDLAIAKIAFQIQATEQPRFGNLFIHLGSFHIMLAYFKAVGKFIDDSGLAYVMVESELLANGSVQSFMAGKHFNRCKRLHPTMALGFEILHFKSFLEREQIEIGEDITTYLIGLSETEPSEVDNPALLKLLEKYSEYQDATLKGEYGKTPQFYMTYVNLINHYFMLTRSIRTGDFNLFKLILPKISNLFFVFNQPNYARWLVKYHDNLIKVDETHPGLKQLFERGNFGIKRTDKPFSRQPIDLTLEQTINADAARRLTGVLHFTNSISARQRWSKSHSIRSTIISHVYEETGLQKRQDVTADLEKSRIKKNCKLLQNFMFHLTENINPFDSTLNKNVLYNLATGRAAPEPVATFLTNVEKQGNELRELFISECAESADRFEKPIKRNVVLNFSASGKKKNVKIAGKIQEIKMQRDLFGRLLGVSMDENIDIAKVLSYPLTPVPFSMCHLDGTICKTDKSVLMKVLETKIDSQPPKDIDVVIIDGFFLLHLLKDIPKTFGNISKKILHMITKYSAPRIDLIFDRYFTPSIKDNEHLLRDSRDSYNYVISGCNQIRPADFAKEMRNSKFKTELVKFLINHWTSDEMAPYIGTKTIHLNYDMCYCFKVNHTTVERTVVYNLTCENHEEADTKIVYHACNIDHEANILIKCSDTDVLVIMLGNMDHLRSSVHVWMEVGTGNSQRIIDVSRLNKKLGTLLSNSLPGFHAITGCDFNAAFFRKGKLKPFKILEKSLRYQKALIDLGDMNVRSTSTENIFEVLEEFVCSLYNDQTVFDVNQLRFDIFTRTYKAKNTNERFAVQLKNYDAGNLPPCKAELRQHLMRSHYIANLWSNAHLRNPTDLHPVDCGWIEINGHYEFVWFEGDQLPTLVNDVIIQEADVNDVEEDLDDVFFDAHEEEDDDFQDD